MATNYPEEITKIIAKLNEKNPYYVPIGGLLLILVLDYFLIMQFQLANIRTLNPKVATLSQDLKTARTNITQTDRYKSELKKLSEERQQLNFKIKTKEEVPLIMESLSRIAQKSGVLLDQITPEQASQDVVLKNNDGQYLAIPIRIDARSSYHSLGRFINQLEREEEFFRVASLSIVGNSQDVIQHSINLVISAIIFEKAN
ncbi:MAG: type 4a pilus biogenesis protein PilO [Candidatus Omnitrophota bacterium]|nr:type 4a pilus biogenesis protein PilO [Candidatus Omnitrophota bacterium]